MTDQREQTVAEAHAFVVAAERLAEAARAYLLEGAPSLRLARKAVLRQALADFERVKAAQK